MTRVPKDLGASVQARLRNVARERGEDMQMLLLQFVLERLLHRLASSPHRRDFVLKGAMLFLAWTQTPHRATRDLDLHGSGTPDLQRLATIFQDLCAVAVAADGVAFDAASVVTSRIREDQLYEAVRVELAAAVGTARIAVQVDVGFGDAMQPPPEEMVFPTILEHPAPRLLTYARETVVAEKFHAMVSLGMWNSRMKDFFDLTVLSARFPFSGPRLGEAITATFARRQTALPETEPVALRPDFSEAKDKQAQWTAFVRRNRLTGSDAEFGTVVAKLRAFLWPIVIGLRGSAPMPERWPAGGPWS
ncbi:MAG: nucleotidyl transferase AbiEii/AbiGii toxin family protein [Planctomycetes bacterium]|nr:nucleotidyl transferase AbiEii/AbiGii toxin family protein [Planctomycetota bacterium]